MILLDEAKSLEIIKNFNKLETFKEQIDFLKENNKYLKVMLDNDDQYICFNDNVCIDSNVEIEEYNPFNNFKEIDYFYDSDGVFKLFEYIGINVDGV